MPVYVEQMTSEVDVFAGDLPLSAQQLERLVQIVLKRLAERDRSNRWQREAAEVRDSSVPEAGERRGGTP